MAAIVTLVHGDAGAYGISFPDFPGCVSGGRTLDEALRRGRETLAAHVAFLLGRGKGPAGRSRSRRHSRRPGATGGFFRRYPGHGNRSRPARQVGPRQRLIRRETAGAHRSSREGGRGKPLPLSCRGSAQTTDRLTPYRRHRAALRSTSVCRDEALWASRVSGATMRLTGPSAPSASASSRPASRRCSKPRTR